MNTNPRKPVLLCILLSVLLFSAGAISARVEASVRHVEARVVAGSQNNSLSVRVETGEDADAGPVMLRFASSLSPLIENSRIERYPTAGDASPTFLVLFDVAAEAALLAGERLPDWRLAVESAMASTRFDIDQIVVTLTIELPSEPERRDDDETSIPDSSQPGEGFGDWDEAVADASRGTTSSAAPESSIAPAVPDLRRPAPLPVPDIAGQADGIADRARADKARTAGKIRDAVGVLTGVAETIAQRRSGGRPPGVYGPVVPADQIPGSPTGGAGESGQRQPPSGSTRQPTLPPIPSGSRQQCVIFDQLNYGDDAHFVVRVESGRPGDATGYYIVSVSSQQRFGDGSSCSSPRACLDRVLVQSLRGQRTQVLGSHRSRSAARRAAGRSCPKPLNR